MNEADHEPAEEATTDFGFERIAEGDKASRVRRVFDTVAGRYDLMNDLMSAGVHRAWKESLVTLLAPRPGQRLIDLAGGTGDVAQRILARGRAGAPAPDLVICDINAEMLRVGMARLGDRLGSAVWVCGDAERLPFPDRYADGLTIAFGIRNVTRRAAALAEIRRVLKVGGKFACLEFSAPVVPVLDNLYERFSLEVIPRIGAVIAKDEASYRYLVESIRRFPDQEAFAEEIRAAGLKRVQYRNLSGGIVAIHTAWAY